MSSTFDPYGFEDNPVIYNAPIWDDEEYDYLNAPEDESAAGAMETLRAIGSAIALTPKTAISGIMSAVHEPDVVTPGFIEEYQKGVSQDVEDLQKEYSTRAKKSVIPGVKLGDIAAIPESWGFTAGAAGAALAGGAAGALVPVPGASTAGAFLASEEFARRSSRNQYIKGILDHANNESISKTGNGITADEQTRLKDKFDDAASEYGLWESIPEAAGTVAELSLLKKVFSKTLGKTIPGRIALTIAAAAAGGATELGTEAITQHGQHNVDVRAGQVAGQERSFTNLADIEASAMEVLPATLLTGLAFGGLGGAHAGVKKVAEHVGDIKHGNEYIAESQAIAADNETARTPEAKAAAEAAATEAARAGYAEENAPRLKVPQQIFDAYNTLLEGPMEGDSFTENARNLEAIISVAEIKELISREDGDQVRVMAQNKTDEARGLVFTTDEGGPSLLPGEEVRIVPNDEPIRAHGKKKGKEAAIPSVADVLPGGDVVGGQSLETMKAKQEAAKAEKNPVGAAKPFSLTDNWQVKPVDFVLPADNPHVEQRTGPGGRIQVRIRPWEGSENWEELPAGAIAKSGLDVREVDGKFQYRNASKFRQTTEQKAREQKAADLAAKYLANFKPTATWASMPEGFKLDEAVHETRITKQGKTQVRLRKAEKVGKVTKIAKDTGKKKGTTAPAAEAGKVEPEKKAEAKPTATTTTEETPESFGDLEKSAAEVTLIDAAKSFADALKGFGKAATGAAKGAAIAAGVAGKPEGTLPSIMSGFTEEDYLRAKPIFDKAYDDFFTATKSAKTAFQMLAKVIKQEAVHMYAMFKRWYEGKTATGRTRTRSPLLDKFQEMLDEEIAAAPTLEYETKRVLPRAALTRRSRRTMAQARFSQGSVVTLDKPLPGQTSRNAIVVESHADGTVSVVPITAKQLPKGSRARVPNAILSERERILKKKFKRFGKAGVGKAELEGKFSREDWALLKAIPFFPSQRRRGTGRAAQQLRDRYAASDIHRIPKSTIAEWQAGSASHRLESAETKLGETPTRTKPAYSLLALSFDIQKLKLDTVEKVAQHIMEKRAAGFDINKLARQLGGKEMFADLERRVEEQDLTKSETDYLRGRFAMGALRSLFKNHTGKNVTGKSKNDIKAEVLGRIFTQNDGKQVKVDDAFFDRMRRFAWSLAYKQYPEGEAEATGGAAAEEVRETAIPSQPSLPPAKAELSRHGMHYDMDKSETIYKKKTSTLDLIAEGLRTSTTRVWSKLPAPGDIITFWKKGTDKQVVVVVTAVTKVTNDLAKNKAWQKEWSKKEGWTVATALKKGWLRIDKSGARPHQVEFRLATANEIKHAKVVTEQATEEKSVRKAAAATTKTPTKKLVVTYDIGEEKERYVDWYERLATIAYKPPRKEMAELPTRKDKTSRIMNIDDIIAMIKKAGSIQLGESYMMWDTDKNEWTPLLMWDEDKKQFVPRPVSLATADKDTTIIRVTGLYNKEYGSRKDIYQYSHDASTTIPITRLHDRNVSIGNHIIWTSPAGKIAYVIVTGVTKTTVTFRPAEKTERAGRLRSAILKPFTNTASEEAMLDNLLNDINPITGEPLKTKHTWKERLAAIDALNHGSFIFHAFSMPVNLDSVLKQLRDGKISASRADELLRESEFLHAMQVLVHDQFEERYWHNYTVERIQTTPTPVIPAEDIKGKVQDATRVDVAHKVAKVALPSTVRFTPGGIYILKRFVDDVHVEVLQQGKEYEQSDFKKKAHEWATHIVEYINANKKSTRAFVNLINAFQKALLEGTTITKIGTMKKLVTLGEYSEVSDQARRGAKTASVNEQLQSFFDNYDPESKALLNSTIFFTLRKMYADPLWRELAEKYTHKETPLWKQAEKAIVEEEREAAAPTRKSTLEKSAEARLKINAELVERKREAIDHIINDKDTWKKIQQAVHEVFRNFSIATEDTVKKAIKQLQDEYITPAEKDLAYLIASKRPAAVIERVKNSLDMYNRQLAKLNSFLEKPMQRNVKDVLRLMSENGFNMKRSRKRQKHVDIVQTMIDTINNVYDSEIADTSPSADVLPVAEQTAIKRWMVETAIKLAEARVAAGRRDMIYTATEDQQVEEIHRLTGDLDEDGKTVDGIEQKLFGKRRLLTEATLTLANARKRAEKVLKYIERINKGEVVEEHGVKVTIEMCNRWLIHQEAIWSEAGKRVNFLGGKVSGLEKDKAEAEKRAAAYEAAGMETEEELEERERLNTEEEYRSLGAYRYIGHVAFDNVSPRKYSEWVRGMKELLGIIWEEIKHLAKAIWRRVIQQRRLVSGLAISTPEEFSSRDLSRAITIEGLRAIEVDDYFEVGRRIYGMLYDAIPTARSKWEGNPFMLRDLHLFTRLGRGKLLNLNSTSLSDVELNKWFSVYENVAGIGNPVFRNLTAEQSRAVLAYLIGTGMGRKWARQDKEASAMKSFMEKATSKLNIRKFAEAAWETSAPYNYKDKKVSQLIRQVDKLKRLNEYIPIRVSRYWAIGRNAHKAYFWQRELTPKFINSISEQTGIDIMKLVNSPLDYRSQVSVYPQINKRQTVFVIPIDSKTGITILRDRGSDVTNWSMMVGVKDMSKNEWYINLLRNADKAEMVVETAEENLYLGKTAKTAVEAGGMPEGAFSAIHDKQMRFEINDSNTTFNAEMLAKLRSKSEPHINLIDLIKHDRLFEEYPELKTVSISLDEFPIEKGGTKRLGQLSYHNRHVSLSKELSDILLMRVLIHELQHYIQFKEGWAIGSADRFRAILENIDGLISEYELEANNEFNTEKGKALARTMLERAQSIKKDRELKRAYNELVQIEGLYYDEYDSYSRTIKKAIDEGRLAEAKSNALWKALVGLRRGTPDFEKTSKEMSRFQSIGLKLYGNARKLTKERDEHTSVLFADKVIAEKAYEKLIDKYKSLAYDAYRLSAGEIEARDAAERFFYSDKVRVAAAPYSAIDTQILSPPAAWHVEFDRNTLQSRIPNSTVTEEAPGLFRVTLPGGYAFIINSNMEVESTVGPDGEKENVGGWKITDGVGVIRIAKLAGGVGHTVDHELFHMLTNIFLTKSEQSMILELYGNWETAAEAYANWDGKLEVATAPAITSTFGKILNLVRDLIFHIKSVVFNVSQQMKRDRLFREIASGNIYNRTPQLNVTQFPNRKLFIEWNANAMPVIYGEKMHDPNVARKRAAIETIVTEEENRSLLKGLLKPDVHEGILYNRSAWKRWITDRFGAEEVEERLGIKGKQVGTVEWLTSLPFWMKMQKTTSTATHIIKEVAGKWELSLNKDGLLVTRYPFHAAMADIEDDRYREKSELDYDFLLKTATFQSMNEAKLKMLYPIMLWSTIYGNRYLSRKELSDPNTILQIYKKMRKTAPSYLLSQQQIDAYLEAAKAMEEKHKQILESAKLAALRPYQYTLPPAGFTILKQLYEAKIAGKPVDLSLLENRKFIETRTDVNGKKYKLNTTKNAWRNLDAKLNEVKKLRSSMGKLGGFFPLKHMSGPYYVKVTRKWRSAEKWTSERGEVVASYGADTAKQAEKIAAFLAMQPEYKGMEVKADRTSRQHESAYWTLGDLNLTRMVDIAISETAKEEGLSFEEARDMSDRAHQAIVDMLRIRGAASSSVSRKLLEWKESPYARGYMEDGLRDVVNSYAMGYHGLISKSNAAFRYISLVHAIPKNMGTTYKQVSEYASNMLRNQDKGDKVVGWLKRRTFEWYLLGKVSLGWLQLIQNFVTAIPALTVDMRNAGTPNWGIAAEKLYLTSMLDCSFHSKRFPRLAADELTFLETGKRRGYTMARLTADLKMQAAAPHLKIFKKMFEILAAPIEWMEVWNRNSAALSYYRFLKATPKFSKLSMEEMQDMTEDFINRTHFWYGKGNLPTLAQGSGTFSKVASVAYTFVPFTHNYFESIRHMFTSGGSNDGLIYLGKSLFYVMLFGGLGAIPFLEDLVNFIEDITKYPIRASVRAKIKSTAGYTLERFAFSGIPGIVGFDLSAATNPLQLPGFMKGENVMGVASGIPTGLHKAYRELVDHGALMRAIQYGAPTFLANMAKGYNLATEGALYPKTGEPVLFGPDEQQLKLTLQQAGWQAMGIKNYEYGQSMEDLWTMRRLEMQYKEAAQALKVRAKLANTPEELAAVMSDMEKLKAPPWIKTKVQPTQSRRSRKVSDYYRSLE